MIAKGDAAKNEVKEEEVQDGGAHEQKQQMKEEEAKKARATARKLLLRLGQASKIKRLKAAMAAAGFKNEYAGDSPFVPSCASAGPAFCDNLEVGPDDLVVDLGCGHAQVLIEAAKR